MGRKRRKSIKTKTKEQKERMRLRRQKDKLQQRELIVSTKLKDTNQIKLCSVKKED